MMIAAGRGLTALVVSVVTAMSLGEGTAGAQVRGVPGTAPSGIAALSEVATTVDAVGPREVGTRQPIRDSIGTIDFGPPVPARATGASAQPASGSGRSTTRKIVGTVLGATAGFFAGGYLGAAIEGDCQCDDPGL